MKFLNTIYLSILNSKVNYASKTSNGTTLKSYTYNKEDKSTKSIGLSTLSTSFTLRDFKTLFSVVYTFIIEELVRTKNLFFNSNLN